MGNHFRLAWCSSRGRSKVIPLFQSFLLQLTYREVDLFRYTSARSGLGGGKLPTYGTVAEEKANIPYIIIR